MKDEYERQELKGRPQLTAGELLKVLATAIAANPRVADLPVETEGCDCQGECSGINVEAWEQFESGPGTGNPVWDRDHPPAVRSTGWKHVLLLLRDECRREAAPVITPTEELK